MTRTPPDWERLERDVVERIHALRIMAELEHDPEIEGRIWDDLVLPCVQLLAKFCVAIELQEEP